MYRGELRFFLNWQMDKETSASLFKAKSDSERSAICKQWIDQTQIGERFKPQSANEAQMCIVKQFTDLNCDFAKK